MIDYNLRKKLKEYKEIMTYRPYSIKSAEENRIDRILYSIYETEDHYKYWKIICYLNDITFPFNELVTDRILRAPSILDLKTFLANNGITLNNDEIFNP